MISLQIHIKQLKDPKTGFIEYIVLFICYIFIQWLYDLKKHTMV